MALSLPVLTMKNVRTITQIPAKLVFSGRDMLSDSHGKGIA